MSGGWGCGGRRLPLLCKLQHFTIIICNRASFCVGGSLNQPVDQLAVVILKFYQNNVHLLSKSFKEKPAKFSQRWLINLMPQLLPKEQPIFSCPGLLAICFLADAQIRQKKNPKRKIKNSNQISYVSVFLGLLRFCLDFSLLNDWPGYQIKCCLPLLLATFRHTTPTTMYGRVCNNSIYDTRNHKC